VKSPTVGDTIDRRYRLKREIARGSMGIVFEAVHAFTGQSVAIKVVNGQAERVKECRERLRREARALAAVRHPNVVEILDAGVSPEGEPYAILEMLEGRPLDGILATRRRITPADAVHIGRQVCAALAFAHSRGIVHRDLKPGSIFIAHNEFGEEIVKLFDFGIAQVPSEMAGSKKLTKDGTLLGTPEYMAPEQLLARGNVDHRCDIYATGVTLFECLAGDVPYTGTYPEVLMKVMAATGPPSLRAVRPDITEALSAAIEKALQKDVGERYGQAFSFGAALVTASGLSEGSSTLLGTFRAQPAVRSKATVEPSTLPAEGRAGAPVTAEPSPPPEQDPRQRRRYARVPYVTQARIIGPTGATLDGRAEDISEGGLLVLTERRCNDGELIRVRFALPITGAIATVGARSRWIYTARGRYATGLEFIDLADDAKTEIARYAEIMRPPPEP